MKTSKLIKELIMELMQEICTIKIEKNQLITENIELKNKNHELQREINFQENTITEL